MNALDSEISRAEQDLILESIMFFSILVVIEIHWFDLKKTSAAYVLPFVRDRVSHPNKETGSRNCVALIFIFLDYERELSSIIYIVPYCLTFRNRASYI